MQNLAKCYVKSYILPKVDQMPANENKKKTYYLA